MKIVTIFILIFSMHAAFASDNEESIQETIKSLGLDIEHFSTIWPYYCKPHWRSTYKGDLLKTSDLVINANKHGFMNARFDEGKTILSPGKACEALLNYYLDDKTSRMLSDFIERDRQIRNRYGFSSLDLYKTSANYFETINTYNWKKEDVRFLEKIIERHRKANTFIIEKKMKSRTVARKNGEFLMDEDGEFQYMPVEPYAVYYFEPSEALKNAHKELAS